MSKLILSLPWQNTFTVRSPAATEADSVYRYVFVTQTGQIISSGHASAGTLPSAKETIVVVATQAISWHLVDIPKISANRLRTVLDGLLEERLLDEMNTLALALAPNYTANKASKNTWVAAIHKNWLRQHIENLQTAGHKITQITPEYSPTAQVVLHATKNPLNAEEPPWLHRTDTKGVVVVPFTSASAILLDLMPILAKNSTVNHDTSVNANAHVQNLGPLEAYTDPALTQEMEKITSILAHAHSEYVVKPILRTHNDALITSSQSPWELAQFDQTLRGEAKGLQKITQFIHPMLFHPNWLWFRLGILGILLVSVLALNVRAWQHRKHLKATQTEQANTLQQTFPNVKTVVDAHVQMQKEIQALRQATGTLSNASVEVMLSQLSNALTQSTGNSSWAQNVSGFEYNTNGNKTDNQLRVQGVKPPADVLASATLNMQRNGYLLTESNGDLLVSTLSTGLHQK